MLDWRDLFTASVLAVYPLDLRGMALPGNDDPMQPGGPGGPDGPDGMEPERGRELGVVEAEPQLRKAPRRRVIMLNDDYTPMEFVVALLEQVFAMDRERATRVMLQVHTRGSGVCGVYTSEVAEALCNEANATARAHEHPLTCETEPVEDDD